ncbi:MAG: polyprenyl synthetase family protein [Muribaculaceae bacterium]|nr:polyprenyl synthetase family protein [Muribaculaceae bacterium]
MRPLEHIQSFCADDLARLNERIHECLRSSSEFMTRVVEENLRSKGKQIRPLVLILSARLAGGTVDSTVLDAAAAVELLHNASLIHDDIVDDSRMRRGRPTLNAVWDNHVAVLVGDFYTTAAMQRAIATGKIEIIDTLCHLGRRLSLGEIEQLFFAREHSLSEDNYYKVIDYKTSSLFVASARMGCQAVGADSAVTEALTEFALLFGRCFQLRDDIFDFYDSEVVGKPTGNDLREGKVSLPLIHVLLDESTPGRETALELLRHDELSDEEIRELQALARDCGGIDYAFRAMEALRDRAAAVLAPLPDVEEKKLLLELFDFVIARSY